MKKTAVTILGWVISAALLASLAAKIDFHALGSCLYGASILWIALAALINVIVVLLKAMRWRWLMMPEGPAPYGKVLGATLIGMAGNNVLPARGGDWMKIYLLNKWSGSSAAGLASITGLDKIFDGIAIVILFAIFSLHSKFPDWVKTGTVEVSIVLAVSLVICVLLLLYDRHIPDEREHKLGAIRLLAKKLGSGMGALMNWRIVASVVFVSVISCAFQVATIWCCQNAFGLHLDPWVVALVFVAINLALTIPAAPSGIGPFEAAAVLAYAWLGIGTEVAMSVALMYHAVQFFPVTIAGFVCYLSSGKIEPTTKLSVGTSNI